VALDGREGAHKKKPLPESRGWMGHEQGD